MKLVQDETVLMKEDSITYAGNQEVQLEDDASYVYHSSQDGSLYDPVSMHLENDVTLLYPAREQTVNTEENPCIVDEPYWYTETRVPVVVSSNRSTNAKKQHVCTECNKAYTSANQLRSHSRIHSGDPYVCSWQGCSKVFNSSYGLKTHYRIHTGEKPFSCEYKNCSKAFRTSGDLQKHMRTHTGEKPYKCPVKNCNKAFTTSSICKVHIRTHTGEKPHKCEICKKNFSNITNYQNHKRIHTGEKPFRCSFEGCKKQFTEYSSLYKHQAVHYKIKCDLCSKFCRNTKVLNRHKMKAHVLPADNFTVEITASDSPSKDSICSYSDVYFNEDGIQEDFDHVISSFSEKKPTNDEDQSLNISERRSSSDHPVIFSIQPERNLENNSAKKKKKSAAALTSAKEDISEFAEWTSPNFSSQSNSLQEDEQSNFVTHLPMIEIDGQQYTLQYFKDETASTSSSSHITCDEGFVGHLVVEPEASLKVLEPSDGFADRFIISDAPIEGAARPTTSRSKVLNSPKQAPAKQVPMNYVNSRV